MEKQGSGSLELQCVGKLEIARPKPAGFLCGSIPVTTDEAFHDFSSAALVPSPNTLSAPRYRMIPAETDLNALPLLSSIPERVLPIAAAQAKTDGDSSWEGVPIAPSLARKGEALAVTGLAEYGDEIDVIAPADILKQVFKIPYSKARVSIAVHRVGQTLVLNSGPDTEEGEKLIRRQNHQPKCVDQSLFLNFAMHSVRMEACDCPPSHKTHNTSTDEQFKSSIYPDECITSEGSLGSSNHPKQVHHAPHRQREGIVQKDKYGHQEEFPSGRKDDDAFWGKKKNKRHKGSEAIKKVSEVQESEKYRKIGADDFLRILFWQFHNFRMLLGSDLLIFSNEKFAAVSLHLWDVSRKVTPLTWLEAWLDNFMASVPELAICYHENGVVQGYELLKTDDIFLLKGVSDDGTPAFHPNVVQQNGLSVMRFLEENCKQDPGAYWLYKSAGEDVVQLFDLSVIPKNHSADNCHDATGPLPSLIYGRRSDSVLSLGTLLYRIAHRLSLSMSSNNRARCASFFQKCLSFLDEPDHLVVRALAHEQFARLLLTYNEEFELTSAVPPVKSEVIISDAEEVSVDFISGSTSSIQDIVYPPVSIVEKLENAGSLQHVEQEKTSQKSCGQDIPSFGMTEVVDMTAVGSNVSDANSYDFAASNLLKKTEDLVQTVSNPLSSKLAAIHHVSQAIKSLRWTRQLQSARQDLNLENEVKDDFTSSMDFSVCACGDSDCIEVCDIREWLPTSKIDDKLWKLVLLLGESYLALGQVYKDDGQLYQALKVVELACLVYGSMPQDTGFISSMVCSSFTQNDDKSENKSAMNGDVLVSSNYLFWSKAWTLVGDVHVDFYLKKGQDVSSQREVKECTKSLKISSEVLKEVVRLKKKIGQFTENCRSCSLVNCSCQSDRASSGSSASSSARDAYPSAYGRKQIKKPHGRNSLCTHTGDNNNHVSQKVGLKNTYGPEHINHQKSDSCVDSRNENFTISDAMEAMNLKTANSETADVSKEKDNAKGAEETHPEAISTGKSAAKSGGIFKFLRGSVSGDADCKLSGALNCYEEALKAMGRLPPSSTESHSVLKKKGWVCNELGRSRIERKDLSKAETAFVKAIDAFREVEDHTNVILINCNLGHGRRALAEDMVSKVESLKKHAMFQNAYLQALETAKLQYREALRYYGAAKTELNAFVEKVGPLSSSVKNEVNTQFAHTYLKLGMLLARENTFAEVYENGVLEDCSSPSRSQTQIEHRKHEISANDAIREALAVYESLGEVRRQEAAYAYFQLACYQRDCVLRFMESDQKQNTLNKVQSSVVQKVKQYASLAERNWQKSIDFYGPKTHPVMFLTILIDRSALLFSLSSYLHSSMMLESALTRLLEGRLASKSTSLRDQTPEICAKFWSQLQTVLKSMLATARSTRANKHPISTQQTPSKSSDAKKLSELYKISLKSPDFGQLNKMHSLWTT
ncbi:hypothetical protein AAHA92_33634 [Salvia divinorum]|uniref:EDRF1 N-terminal domain-containing protein n=1 Tax=Salvia divinorum TaxID=28513 RepID=A0ABD1FPN4_SALDI